jgi:hypothetical protein
MLEPQIVRRSTKTFLASLHVEVRRGKLPRRPNEGGIKTEHP